MTTLHAGTVLTPEERLARRRLILRDTISLLTLFLIALVLFVLTLLLNRSFTNHEQELGDRWRARGEEMLRQGRPKDAVPDLRSALAYVSNRQTEIDLATALAEAGRTVEATAYFNTLRESAPGDGMINLQLARLAARAGNEPLAVLRYQEALDGTWENNGFERRRQVRLELSGYLISRRQFDQARTQLLIASSNAPDLPAIKLQIAGLLEQAQDPQDALGIYRAISARHAPPVAALEGAGRTAFQLGMYRLAADYLGRAVANAAEAKLPQDQQNTNHSMLDTSVHVLLLYPDINLPARARAERILAARNIANQRLTNCMAANNSVPELAALLGRWQQLPAHLTANGLAQQPDLEQSMLQLIYDTEIQTAQVCGAPTGDDALLLRIARNPGAVEQE